MTHDSLRSAIINEVEESINQEQDPNKLSIRMVNSVHVWELFCSDITGLINLYLNVGGSVYMGCRERG